VTGRRKRRGKPLKSIAIVHRSAKQAEQRLSQVLTPLHKPAVALGYLTAAWRRGDPSLAAQSSEWIFQTIYQEAQRFDAVTVANFKKAKEWEAS
jgi:hypothetical protein